MYRVVVVSIADDNAMRLIVVLVAVVVALSLLL
jgi:hypothetical protein